MHQLKSIVVDDELNGIENLETIINEFCPQIELLGNAQTLEDAEVLIHEKAPDLVFLDIQIGTRTIFDLLQKLGEIKFEIIFISAHDHSMQAFKYMAIDYLLKPVDIQKLKAAITRAEFNLSKRRFADHAEQLLSLLKKGGNERSKVAIPTSDGYEFVLTNDILYCSADRSYTTIALCDGRTLTASQNLKHYEDLLPEEHFLRIHNSHITNLNCVKKISRANGGYIIMEDNKELPFSKSRKEQLFRRLELSK